MCGDVIIAIPTLNEAATIDAVLSHFIKYAPSAGIVVVDGGSTDGTLDRVRRHGAHIHLLDNPDRFQSAGMNRAARWAEARGARVLIRVDAHARYPEGFVAGLVETLDREQADSVVVPLLAAGTTGWQAANALLQGSWLGHGGAIHRRKAAVTQVTHGHHAAFRLRAFRALGGYDASLDAAEDVEFDHRLVTAGGRIVMAPRLAVNYLPRPTPGDAFRQFHRNGRARARVLRKHRLRPALRQVLPCLVGIGWFPSLLAGLIWPLAALPCLAYLSIVTLLSLLIARGAPLQAGQIAILAVLSHSGYAIGVLRGATGRKLPQPFQRVPA